MSYTFTTNVGDGSTVAFPFSFAGADLGYIAKSNISVFVAGVLVSNYTIPSNDPNKIYFTTAPAIGAEVLIRRIMPKNVPYADFSRGNPFSQDTLNDTNLQQLYVVQELLDGFLPDGFYMKQDVNMGGHKLINLGAGTSTGDSVNYDQWYDHELRIEGLENDLTGVSSRTIPYYYIATGGEVRWQVSGRLFDSAIVFINGIFQNQNLGAFSISGNGFNFPEPLQQGDEVYALIGSYISDPDNHPTFTEVFNYIKDAITGVADVGVLRATLGVSGQHINLKEYNTGTGLGGGRLIGVGDTTTADNGVTFFRVNSSFGWRRLNPETITLQDAGAVGDAIVSGTTVLGTDDTTAVLRAFSSRVPIKENTPHKYRLDSSVSLPNGDVNFKGVGKGTVFVFNHFSAGLTFGTETYSSTKFYGKFSDCSCVRPNYLAYLGSAGPKSFSFGNFEPLSIKGITESNAIGYGIFVVFSKQVTASGNSASDHVGTFDNPKSGTDGLHFYKCNDVWAHENKVSNVGDDGISSGSFDINYPCTNINFLNNSLSRVFGTLKLYGFVDKAEISGNTFLTGHEAGVYLTNDNNAPQDSYVKNVKIHHNKFSGIVGDPTNVVAGAVLLRTWPDNSVAQARSKIDHIYIEDNIIESCGSGVALVTQDTYKRYSNVFIRRNTFKGIDLSLQGSRPYIRIHQCDYQLEIKDNYFNNAHSHAISVDHIYGSFTASNTLPTWDISDNQITGYSEGSVLTARVNGILVRYSSFSLFLQMVGNKVYGQAVSDSQGATQGILVNNINPNSFVEANQSDNNIAISGGTTAYKGTAKTRTGAPSSGTHYAGSTITDYSNSIRYTIKTSGTFGSIGTVNATTTAGSKSVVIDDPTNLYVGAIISIAGVTGSKKVLVMNGVQVVVDTACDVSVSGAAVSFVAPTMITESMV